MAIHADSAPLDSATQVLEQYKLVRDQIQHCLLRLERALALAIAAMAAVAAFGGLSDANPALLLLPLGIIGAYLYGSQQLLEVMALGGYGKFLEERLNELTGEPVWLWELGLVKPVHRSPGGITLGVIYLLTVILALTLTTEALSDDVHPVLLVSGWFFVAIIVGITNYQVNAVAKRGYDAAVEMYEERAKRAV